MRWTLDKGSSELPSLWLSSTGNCSGARHGSERHPALSRVAEHAAVVVRAGRRLRHRHRSAVQLCRHRRLIGRGAVLQKSSCSAGRCAAVLCADSLARLRAARWVQQVAGISNRCCAEQAAWGRCCEGVAARASQNSIAGLGLRSLSGVSDGTISSSDGVC